MVSALIAIRLLAIQMLVLVSSTMVFPSHSYCHHMSDELLSEIINALILWNNADDVFYK